ncbi:hypothetical protein KC343_g5459 [Hortaea werneckii]|uniref:VPS9 domain-containing protein n=1 Tax=Hortaea werneckii TaxID=91943 RepID=A0A3M7DXW1_HORWE|nr:hypothetical protein KC343_g5459 [Hortaea werneckii]RMY69158.1 hypothetical protein D0864_11178 [Hortaea werneckii]
MSGLHGAEQQDKLPGDGHMTKEENGQEMEAENMSTEGKGGVEGHPKDSQHEEVNKSSQGDAPNADTANEAAMPVEHSTAPENHVEESRKAETEEVEKEASEHLARRAAEMDLTGGSSAADEPAKDNPATEEKRLQRKPSMQIALGEVANPGSVADQEYDEKHPPSDEPQSEVPEAPQGTTEATGEEIQTIMDQFRQGMGGLGEQEIMSPRFERQQPMLVLPPRTSSLEPKESHTMSPQATGQSISSERSGEQAARQSSTPGSGIHHVKSDDSESISSARAGSIFQPPPPSPEPEPALPFDFHRFLEQLRHRTADPVARFLRSFLSEFGKKQWMVHEQVKIISDFLEFISKRMAQCEVWRTVSDAEFDNAREGMEKLVMNRLYNQTFSPLIPPASNNSRKSGKDGRSQADNANSSGPGRRGQHQEDVERDEVIAQKLRIYGWISEDHLDIKSIGEKGKKFLGLAQQELLKINTYRAPRDKVICVLNCCKVIFGYLKNTKSDQSADAFIPLLIYTVLRAKPEHLVSNVQYIWRFRNQDKLGGEAGYYMSSLMGVVSFIETLDRTNLTISDEEFERNVEQAVSAIAEKNKEEEYEAKAHASRSSLQHLSEKSALSRPEVTPRNSMEAEQSSPKRNASQRLSDRNQPGSQYTQGPGNEDDNDAVTGLLKTIQKPLSSIGRMFSDDNRPMATPQPTSTPRTLSPTPQLDRRSSGDGRRQRPSPERQQSARREQSAARQVGSEAAQAQNMRRREYHVVVETLQSMFPNLDKEVIQDVTRAQEGNVGRAVDACLALSG